MIVVQHENDSSDEQWQTFHIYPVLVCKSRVVLFFFFVTNIISVKKRSSLLEKTWLFFYEVCISSTEFLKETYCRVLLLQCHLKIFSWDIIPSLTFQYIYHSPWKNSGLNRWRNLGILFEGICSFESPWWISKSRCEFHRSVFFDFWLKYQLSIGDKF